MIKDIRFHGQYNEMVDYFVTVAGQDIINRFFYDIELDKGSPSLRFFAQGNEFILNDKGISYKGNGGSFCEYMFGVNQPIKDMVKKEVINRLVMHGTIFDELGENLIFTDSTTGSETYDEVFINGNAICNHYFFIQGNLPKGLREQQEYILKKIGRVLKRSLSVGISDEITLIKELFESLEDTKSTLFLFKLIHRYNTEYYNLYKRFYYNGKIISEQEREVLEGSAKKYDIKEYQLERIKIDVLYKHPDNKRIIDEYKDILVSFTKDKEINQGMVAKLNRLRSLSVRNNIPLELFSALDELLLKDKEIAKTDEPEYIRGAREILEGIFIGGDYSTVLTKEDLATLLKAKQIAVEKRDFSFEGLLLETGRVCDERSRDGGDTKALEFLGQIVTLFDRFDSVFSYINQIVFMENVEISEEKLRSILRNKKIFDEINPRLFKELFIDNILRDKYITVFGRQKIYVMFKGVKDVEEGNATLSDVVNQLKEINEEAILYRTVHYYFKRRIKNFYLELQKTKDHNSIRKDMSKELMEKRIIKKEIPAPVFSRVFQDIKEEAVYIYEVFPQILASRNTDLRERFLKESGLDRYYMEDLEKEYAELNGIDLAVLNTIQRGT